MGSVVSQTPHLPGRIAIWYGRVNRRLKHCHDLALLIVVR